MPAMWRGRSAYTPPSWHQAPQTLVATILSLSFKDFKGLCKIPRDGAHHIQTSSLPLSPSCPHPAFGPCVYLCQGLETQQRMKLGGIPRADPNGPRLLAAPSRRPAWMAAWEGALQGRALGTTVEQSQACCRAISCCDSSVPRGKERGLWPVDPRALSGRPPALKGQAGPGWSSRQGQLAREPTLLPLAASASPHWDTGTHFCVLASELRGHGLAFSKGGAWMGSPAALMRAPCRANEISVQCGPLHLLTPTSPSASPRPIAQLGPGWGLKGFPFAANKLPATLNQTHN